MKQNKQVKKSIPVATQVVFSIIFVAVGLIVGLLLASHSQPMLPTQITLSSQTSDFITNQGFEAGEMAFSSEDEYLAFIAEQSSSMNYRGGVFLETASFGGMKATNDVAVDTVSFTQSGASEDSSEYSTTNNQVESVDEADLIKTNGDYIYTVTDETLFIVDTKNPQEAQVIATYEFEQVAQSLFLEDDVLVVFSYSYNRPEMFSDLIIEKIGSWPRQGMTTVSFMDISNPVEPKLVEEYQLEGRYDTARLSQGYVYLILHQTPYERDVYPTPLILRNGEIDSVAAKDIYYYPQRYDYPQLVLTHSFNIMDASLVDSKAVAVDNANDAYVSQNAIYLTGYDYFSEYELRQEVLQEELESYLTESDKQLIKKINAVDSEVLSSWEKEQKIQQVYYDVLYDFDSKQQDAVGELVDEKTYELMSEMDHFDYTTISKVTYKNGNLNLGASTKVPGRILNQFSLDEDEGVLRVATTQSQTWFSYKDLRRESTSAVWTFDEDLNQLGSLENLAEEEDIFAVRFMGDRLYLVTFEQIDPFFVIDLSDASKPEVLGELKIPGFSNYLHPYDENHVIGLGRDATSTGRTQGLKISLFNVEDVKNPIEVASYVSEEKYVQSTATYEHKAFLFSKEKNLLVIPAYNAGYDDSDVYNGAFWFSITPEDISLEGLIDHSMATDASNSMYRWQPLVQRSLYIDDVLYTKSPTLIRSHDITTKEAILNIELEQPSSMVVL